VFLVLEELGYLVMSISFLFAGIAIAAKNRLETAVRWIFIMAFILVVLSLVVVSAIYGLERLDRFEVLAVSVNWLVLVVNGVLLSIMFRRQMRSATRHSN
jgi:hypothetical membrane protein